MGNTNAKQTDPYRDSSASPSTTTSKFSKSNHPVVEPTLAGKESQDGATAQSECQKPDAHKGSADDAGKELEKEEKPIEARPAREWDEPGFRAFMFPFH